MASQAQPPKVLRIGIIMDGKIVQERLIKAGASVTVGDSAKNTFVLPKTHLPKSEFALFVAKGNAYVLNFTEQMKGKISTNGAVVGLEKVRTDPSVSQQGGTWRLPLSEQDRGKINIDNVTVLFQFVPAPPTQVIRPITASDFKPRLVGEDDGILFAFMALFSSLAFVFMIYVWNADVHEMTSIDEIDDRWKKLVIQQPEPVDLSPQPSEQAQEAPAKTEQKSESEAKTPQSSGDNTPKPSAEERKADLAKNNLVLQFLSTRGDSANGQAQDLFSADDKGLSDIDSAIRGASGTANATADNKGLRANGGSGGTGDADIGGISKIGGGTSSGVAAAEVKVRSKVTTEQGDAGDLDEGAAGELKRTVSRNAGQLKYCYDERLKTNPNLAGRIEVEWVVTNGRVASANIVANTSGDAEFGNCIVGKIKHWTFPTTIPAGSEVSFPFVFSAQQ